MTEILSAAQMRAWEMAEIESGQVTGLALMERAGHAVVAAVLAHWPHLQTGAHRAAVLAGPGNNGGDGYVIARCLRDLGWDVHVYAYGDPARLGGDAAQNHARWAALGPVRDLLEHAQDLLEMPQDLLVDALFGTGLGRGVDGALAELLAEMFTGGALGLGGAPCPVVAVDIPSGLCADSGRVLCGADGADRMPVLADLTVSFHRAKRGHHLADGPDVCGALVVADIGLCDGPAGNLPPYLAARLAPDILLAARPDPTLLDKPAGQAHKYSHGHALILSGGAGQTGAARLAARAALRVGAGAVTLGAPPAAMMDIAHHIEAEMLRALPTPAALADVLRDPRITALCLGPGFGTGRRQMQMLKQALCGQRVVLDADALSLLARMGNGDMRLHDGVVLTPHWGEFARLFPDLAEEAQAAPIHGPAVSKADIVRRAAMRVGAVVVLKGPDTVIAAPDGRMVLNAATYDHSAPWLATAGSGDVLAGAITGLLARGADPLEAAYSGAWIHAEAGRRVGAGLIASDLPDAIAGVLRSVLNG